MTSQRDAAGPILLKQLVEVKGLQEVREAIVRLGLAAKDTRAPRNEIGEEMLVRTHQRFRLGLGPDGPWEKSRRAKRTGGETLVESGTLESRAAYDTPRTDLQLFVSDKRGRVHQLGLTIEAKNGGYLTFPTGEKDSKGRERWARVREVHMPERPYLYFTTDDIEMAAAVMADHFGDAFTGGASGGRTNAR